MQHDLLSGLAARDIALDTHEVTYRNWLDEARAKAFAHATAHGTVTSDDVHILVPVPAWVHHNAMGAVFRDHRFISTGFVQTKRKSGHARWIHSYGVR